MPRAALHARSRARRSAAASIVLLGAVIVAAPFAVLGVSGGVLLAVLTAVAVVATATSGGPALAPPRRAGPPARPPQPGRPDPRPPLAHPPLAEQPSPPPPVATGPPAQELVFELLYVDQVEGGFALDGSVAADLGPELPAGTLFHLRLEPPPSGALRVMTESVLRAWVEQGSLVAIRFRRKAERVKAHLTSDGTTIVLDVDDASVA